MAKDKIDWNKIDDISFFFWHSLGLGIVLGYIIYLELFRQICQKEKVVVNK